MFGKPSLVTRIAIGKGIGFVIGIMAVFLLPYLLPEPGMMLRLAFLFWYVTVGAVIGMFGVFTWHPILRLPMPWWIRAPAIGAWLNFVLALFIHDLLAEMMVHVFGENGALSSPFWFVADGAVIGLLIGYLATRFGGDGPQTAGR